MTVSARPSTLAALRGPDDLAVIGRTLHDLRGIRFGEGEGGGEPKQGEPEPEPKSAPAPKEPEPKEPDWKAEARKHEDRSKEWKAKAEANEDAARRLKEIEDGQKTETQKAQEKLADAEKRAAEAETRALIADVAAAKKVPAALLKGSTKEELEAFADQLIEFQGAKPPVGSHLPNQDKTPQKQPSDLAAAARKIFGGQ